MLCYANSYVATCPDSKQSVVLYRLPVDDAVYGSEDAVIVQVCMNRVAGETDLYNREENNVSSATETAVEAILNT